MVNQPQQRSAQGSRPQAGQGPRHGPPAGGPPREYEPKTIAYWIDGKPNPALMDEEAEAIGRKLALQDQLKPTQLRRHYEAVLNLKNRLDALEHQYEGGREGAFVFLRADFKMLRAKAHYARGRDPNMFPDSLLHFFCDHVHSVKKAKDFDIFFKHFQAVVAFHRFYKPKD